MPSMPEDRFSRTFGASCRSTLRGSPSAIFRPKFSTSSRSTTASERVHDVLDPDDRDAASRERRGSSRRARRIRSRSARRRSRRGAAARGSAASARASSRRLRSSSVSVPARRLASGRSPVCSSTRPHMSAHLGDRCRSRQCVAPTSRFSKTVRFAKGCGIWNERAMPARARACGEVAGDVLARRGGSRRNPAAATPAIRLKSEDFPAPFGPMMPSAAPSSISRSIPSATTTEPKAFDRRSS